MPELLESLPQTEKWWLTLTIFAISAVYVFGLVRHYTHKKKLVEANARKMRKELSLGAESLFFHVPVSVPKKKETNAQ